MLLQFFNSTSIPLIPLSVRSFWARDSNWIMYKSAERESPWRIPLDICSINNKPTVWWSLLTKADRNSLFKKSVDMNKTYDYKRTMSIHRYLWTKFLIVNWFVCKIWLKGPKIWIFSRKIRLFRLFSGAGHLAKVETPPKIFLKIWTTPPKISQKVGKPPP